MDLERYYTAQRAVLGSLLISPDALAGKIMNAVKAEDFSDAALRNIFRAANEVYLERTPLDAVTVAARAGAAYDATIRDIMMTTPTAANVDAYLKILREDAMLSQLHGLAASMLAAPYFETARQYLAEAEGLLTDRPGRKASTYMELVTAYLDRQNDPTPPDYLDFGIDAINRRVSISPGRFVIIGADSSVGKTALALQMAYNIAGTKRVGFFSYETSRDDAADRIMANTADVNLPRTKAKALTKSDIARICSEGERSAGIRLTVVETAGYTVDELRAETLAGRYDVIFIDYVQLVPARQSDRWQVVTEVSLALHTMAQELGVTVIALSQVTPPEIDKNGKRRSLRKSDLRESRQLLNDADAILMMDMYDPRDAQGLRVLKVDKNKDGPTGQIYLSFDAEHMRFTPCDAPKSEQYENFHKSMAQIKREQRAQREAAKRDSVDGQIEFHELPPDEPLPFQEGQ